MDNDDLQSRIGRLELEAQQHLQEMTGMRAGLQRVHDSIQLFHALTLNVAIVVDKILEEYQRAGGEDAGENVLVPVHILKQLKRARDDWSAVNGDE